MLDAIRLKVLLRQLEPFKVETQERKTASRLLVFPILTSQTLTVTKNKRWKLLSGVITHVTGTRSILAVVNATWIPSFVSRIESIESSDDYSMDLKGSLILVEENEYFYFVGGVGSLCYVKVEETSL